MRYMNVLFCKVRDLNIMEIRLQKIEDERKKYVSVMYLKNTMFCGIYGATTFFL